MKSSTLIATLAAALVCLVATNALAADGVPSANMLSDMGLSALQPVSDSDALAVRGMGYKGGHKGPRIERPVALAAGLSWAHIDDGEGGHHGGGDDASAGSINVYAALGNYEASGTNYSDAGRTVVETHQVVYSDGTTSVDTTTRSIHIFAGGYSSAKAF